MITRDTPVENAIVLHPRFGNHRDRDADYDLEEAVGLAEALGVDTKVARIIAIRDLKVSNFFGKGQIEDIKAEVKAYDVNIVIVNSSLSPVQQRNLERIWKAKVIDRTGLILEIFGLRAATKEGKLQVELARMGYERSRLVRTWTHLERQRGGTGTVAGPGETQIESDRRVLNDKMAKLKRELEQVRRTRGLQRQKRKRAPERVAALVGYTNTGKSTLFNILTEGGVFAKDMLFATLDTTHRVLPLPGGQEAILSDTVGFISDLPTDLITAFRATLEEVKEADLLIHVRDISDPLTERRREEVLQVLEEIEAGPEYGQDIIEVWNKTDLLGDEQMASIKERAEASLELEDMTPAYAISAHKGYGLEALKAGIETELTSGDEILHVDIPPQNYDVRAWLHKNGHVIKETTKRNGTCEMDVRLSESDAGKLRARHRELVS